MVNLSRLYSRSRATQGGGRPIFKHNAWDEAVWLGSVLSGDFKKGDVLFAGNFGYYDYKARKSYLLRQFVLAKDLAAEDTKVYFVNTEYTHNLRAGLFITAEPEEATSKGKGILCGAVTTVLLDDALVYEMAITAGSLGTGSKGDVYVEAKGAGDNVEPLLTKVNVIFDEDFTAKNDLSDIQEDSYDDVYLTSPKMHCTIIADLAIIPKIAPANKSAVEEFYQL